MKKVIEVRNLTKKYLIYHERGYATLVETLSNQAKRLLHRLRHPFSPSLRSSQYETFYALQDIDLDIYEGDRVGIIGRNGAGKSTLLKILSRITEPTKGNIKIHGRVSSLLEIGTGFHPELTGRENIYLNGAILGMKKQEIKKKFDHIVSFAEVEKFLDTPVKRYSSGMYTRLGFAIAAHLDSDLLIVDEVLAVGDSQFQEKCLKKLDDLSQRGRTVLFVSHDVGSILTLCNKGIFLEAGRLIEQGPIQQCLNAYMQRSHLHAFHWKGEAGDEHIKFYKMSLSTDHEREFFYQDDQVSVEIEYEVLSPSNDLVIGLGVWNQRNQLLARSHTFDAKHFHIFNQTGRKKASFVLDPKLFHEGDYSIKLECYIHHKKRILHEEISLKFPVFSKRKNTRFSHATEQSGIHLGDRWSLDTH